MNLTIVRCWNTLRSVSISAVLLFLVAPGTARALPFDITVVFGTGLTTSQQAVFSQAEATWESLITGYLPGVPLSGLTINASAPAIDGPGGILGQAGPTYGQAFGSHVYVTEGDMSFDSADLLWLETAGTLEEVILHEMAHVIGFGTVWSVSFLGDMWHEFYDGNGNYTGAYALAAYQEEFNQPGAASIPVELAGGAGTAHGHWDEVTSGAGNTGITDSNGNDMRYELMTGWLNSPTFISNTTIQQFRDIGYTVVPEPGTATLVVCGLLAMGHRRRAGVYARPR